MLIKNSRILGTCPGFQISFSPLVERKGGNKEQFIRLINDLRRSCFRTAGDRPPPDFELAQGPHSMDRGQPPNILRSHDPRYKFDNRLYGTVHSKMLNNNSFYVFYYQKYCLIIVIFYLIVINFCSFKIIHN